MKAFFLSQITSKQSLKHKRFFDEDMKQDLFIMMDRMREMYEDGSKINILREH